MMNIFSRHPDHNVLDGYSANTLDTLRRERLATHVRSCAQCQDTLRFLTRLRDGTSAPAAPASNALLERALRARAAGERHILPMTDTPLDGTRSRARGPGRRFAWAALAASIMLVAYAAFVRPPEVSALSADSDMKILPAKPHPGDMIHVTYRPGGELFNGSAHLVLRARLRTADDIMYSSGVPVSRVQPVAVLTPSVRGEYTGDFTLPPAIAFVSMVVEDSSAHAVDDNGGRLWEVLAHNAHGQPTFDALHQRVNDMMGRSWEEAYATTKRMTTLYPDRVDSWMLQQFFDWALYGDRGGDSLFEAYRPRLEKLIEAARSRLTVSAAEVREIFYSRYVRMRHTGATAADTVDFRYWLERTLREHPRHEQLAQYYAMRFTPEEWTHPEALVDTVERLYEAFAPLRGPGRNLAGVGVQIASRTSNDELYRRWLERSIGEDNRGDSTYVVALAMVARASARNAWMGTMRQMLAAPPETLAGARGLREDHADYLLRAADARRNGFVVFGRALIASGHVAEGVDTLSMAARGTWDLALFRNLQTAFASAGDSAGMRAMRVRIAVDPRTEPDTATAISAQGRARLGAAAWNSLLASARSEMHERMLARSTVRSLRGSPSMLTADGSTRTLREVMDKRPATVVLWSRNCGAAIEALPAITQLADRLASDGHAVLFVVDEPPSAELSGYLAERKWTRSVYYDSRGEVRNALNSFGTPAYYVLDAGGRIRFSGNGDARTDILAQIDALSAERTLDR